mmetsp:Transcript_2543/g.307  ORF Transcript_2543/g.307 Transcript_2543/m.307 type:complete len:81 (+) Transcript_2543:506-748(+)
MTILNRKKLDNYLQKGCKILHLATEIPDENSLVLEKDGIADYLRINEFKGFIEGDIIEYGTSLIVLAYPFSENFGKQLFH